MKSIVLKIQGRKVPIEEIFISFLVKPLFVLFIYFGMFNRVSGVMGLSGGMTAVLISAIFFFLAVTHMFVYSKNTGISHLAFVVSLFFIVAAISPLISSIIYNQRVAHIFRYVLELGVCFAIFFSTYYFIREKLISPKFILYSFVIIGGISAIQILVTSFGISSNYRRLGGDVGGLNYIGNTFAVSALTFIMLLYAKKFSIYKKAFVSIGFVIVFLVMLLTGTRAGFIAFVAGLFLYQVFGVKSKKFNTYILVFTGLIVIAVLIIATQVDLSLLLKRYTYAELERMALVRFNLYYGAVSDLTFIEFLFGRADLAAINDTSLDDVGRYINPHNVFLSLIRFNGIFPFILFFGLLVILYSNYFKIYNLHKKHHRMRIFETTMIIFLSTSFINVMFSGGKFTRNFFLFFAIGYTVGYIEMMRNVKSEQYKKMIL